jgi:uncharacterized protein YcfJ
LVGDALVGDSEGENDGDTLGADELGDIVGEFVGLIVGELEGNKVGEILGDTVGKDVGDSVGIDEEGEFEGLEDVGEVVGGHVRRQQVARHCWRTNNCI